MELQLSPSLKETAEALKDAFGDRILDIYTSSGDTFIRIEPDALSEVAGYLKTERGFIYLSEVTGADRFTSGERFEVIYNLFSFRDQSRLFLKVWLEEEDPTVDSVTGIWKAADWHEREVFDMYGIRFRNHPDLRRIYMPEDFQYYPLRKEFPLLGIPGSIELPSTTPEHE